MNTNFNKALERLIELSAQGGMTVTYTNSIVSLNFKVDDKFDLKVKNDIYEMSYTTETNASPTHISFNVSDIKSVEWYDYGEFKDCECIELIRFIFNDESVMDCYEDFR